MKIFFKCILGAIIYLVSSIIPGILWPLKEELLTGIPSNEAWFSLPSILIVGFVFTAILYFFSAKSRLEIGKRIIVLTIMFYFTTTFMSQIETWYFRAAFPLIDNRTLLLFFLNNLVVAIIFVPSIILIFKHKIEESERLDFNTKNSPVLVVLLSLFYVGVYFFFGKYVAYSSETLRNFYSGWTQISELSNNLWLFQIIRGFMWVSLAWLGVNQFKKSKHAIIGITVFFGFSLSILLIIPNMLMPAEVRFYHGIETFSSMLLYGFACGIILTGKIKLKLFKQK